MIEPLDLDAEFEIVHALRTDEGRTTARERLALVRIVAELTGRLIDEGTPPTWIVRYGDQVLADYRHAVSVLDSWPVSGDPEVESYMHEASVDEDELHRAGDRLSAHMAAAHGERGPVDTSALLRRCDEVDQRRHLDDRAPSLSTDEVRSLIDPHTASES